MVTCFGWTFEYVKWDIDIPTLIDIYNYQKDHPPMHELLAAYVGFESPSKKEKSKNNFDPMEFFMSNDIKESEYSGPRMI